MKDYLYFPEYYDVDHDSTEDIGFFLEFARKSGSPILELGCGTGRVLVPLATRYTIRSELQLLLEKTGFELVDLYRDYDRSPCDGTGEMIAVARKPGIEIHGVFA